MQKTINGAGDTFPFTIGTLSRPVDWQIAVFVDNIGTNSLQLWKNFGSREVPNWKQTSTQDVITQNGTTIFKLIGGGSFKLVPVSTPSSIFVDISF